MSRFQLCWMSMRAAVSFARTISWINLETNKIKSSANQQGLQIFKVQTAAASLACYARQLLYVHFLPLFLSFDCQLTALNIPYGYELVFGQGCSQRCLTQLVVRPAMMNTCLALGLDVEEATWLWLLGFQVQVEDVSQDQRDAQQILQINHSADCTLWHHDWHVAWTPSVWNAAEVCQ